MHLTRFQGTIAAITLAGLLFAALPMLEAASVKARIDGLATRIEDDRILATFQLRDGFKAAVLERVQSGLPTSFDYQLELLRKRRLWWDKELASSSLQVVAMYNAVTREYLINFKQDGKLVDSRVVHDTADLQTAMTSFEDLLVATTEVLPHEGKIQLRIRAQLGSKTVLTFIPKDIHTEWSESRLEPLPAAPLP